MKARIITKEPTKEPIKEPPQEPEKCEFEKDTYCRASDTQNPVIPCKYANYTAHSYYPPCGKK